MDNKIQNTEDGNELLPQDKLDFMRQLSLSLLKVKGKLSSYE